MSVSASTQIPKTSDSVVFQRQCKVLFEHVLNDPHVEEFGTSGQGQRGIDLLGRRRDRALDHWVGIQCKLTIKAPRLKAGEKGVVEVEATRALAFKPALKELIIATTAPNDGPLQRDAALFTDQQAKLGRDFTVQVWGWETLSAHIPRYEVALKAFMPGAFPQLDRVIRGQAKLIEDLDSVAVAQNSFAAELSRTHALLVRIDDRQTAGDIARQVVWDDRSVDTLIDRQIDQLRDMINAGRPRTAHELLEGIWGSLPEGVEGRIRFRIKSNIAACLLRLGEERKAAETYLDAYQHAPTNPKAVSLKVLAHLLLDQPHDALAFGRAALTGSPEQGPLVAYMIAAAKLLPDEDDPLGFITDAIVDDPAVALAKIDYLRSKSAPGVWWDFAIDRHARYPDNENLARAAAEADIDRAAQWAEANDRRPLSDELRVRVTEATAILEQLRAKYAGSELAWDHYRRSLSVNLALGHRLLRQYREAKQAVEAALLQSPNDHMLKQALVIISLESGDYASARRALKGLPGSRDVILGHLQVLASEGDWPEIISQYAEVDLSVLETEDKALLEALALLAQVKLGRIHDAKAQTAALLEKYLNEPIVPTVLYEVAVQERDGVWATELFKTAFAMLDKGNSASRMMLVRLAEREDDAEKVITLLNGYIDVTQDSDELRSLARAFRNGHLSDAGRRGAPPHWRP
jgi:predicted Zn-dependent protease